MAKTAEKGGGWPIRGQDLIMWSEGQWEAWEKNIDMKDGITENICDENSENLIVSKHKIQVVTKLKTSNCEEN